MYTNMKFRITLEKLSIINTFEKSQLPIDIKTDKNLVLELCTKDLVRSLNKRVNNIYQNYIKQLKN